MPNAMDFHALTPERVIEITERCLGVRALPLCRPLASYINRVYEVALTNGDAVIAKFYRPGRWDEEALLDEQEFLFELADADVPVVPPLADAEGISLFEEQGLWICFFERKRGRPFEDPTRETWQELGRLLARLHLVGDQHRPEHRYIWTPARATARHLAFIQHHARFPSPRVASAYTRLVEDFIHTANPLFEDLALTRIHGDCHIANLMVRPGEAGIFLIDFDDMVLGPPVQDLWMLLPGTADECGAELDAFLSGYNTLRDFPLESIRCIEALRAMRFVHFTAWCVQQQSDGGTQRLDPSFGTDAWWDQELRDLQTQLDALAHSDSL